ncbi:MAG: hypothetical protein JO288_21470 [Hyphomicrobiales bacterium]|nr:hypothetical protein [Hyphomicrobiales bacterium]
MIEDGSPPPARGKRRRSTKREIAERNSRLIRNLTIGATVDEIAAREGVSVKRARELVSDLLNERTVETPAEFAQLQIRRLNEAMLVAYAAMANGNLKAVNAVVSIVREYDRYHGFFPRRAEPLALPPPPLALPAPAELEEPATAK